MGWFPTRELGGGLFSELRFALQKSDVMVMFSATEMMIVMFVCPRSCPPSESEHTRWSSLGNFLWLDGSRALNDRSETDRD